MKSDLKDEFRKEMGLRVVVEDGRGNTTYTEEYVDWLENKIKNSFPKPALKDFMLTNEDKIFMEKHSQAFKWWDELSLTDKQNYMFEKTYDIKSTFDFSLQDIAELYYKYNKQNSGV